MASLIYIGGSQGGVGKAVVNDGLISAVGGSSTPAAIVVGQSGTGTLDLESQSTASANALLLGNTPTGVGTVDVSGVGASADITAGSNPDIVVGGQGTGSLTVENQGSVATGSLFVGEGQGASGALTIQTAGTVTAQDLSVATSQGSTGVVTVDGVGSSLSDSGAATNNGAITISNGSQATIGGALSGSGTININSGSTVTLAGSCAAGQVIDFATGNSIDSSFLALADPASFQGSIENFAQGDTIDLTQSDATGATWANDVLTVTMSDGSTVEIDMPGNYQGDTFDTTPASDVSQQAGATHTGQQGGAGGTDITLAGPITLSFDFSQPLGPNGQIAPGTLTATISGGGLPEDFTIQVPAATCDDAFPFTLQTNAAITATFENGKKFAFDLKALAGNPLQTGVLMHQGTVGDFNQVSGDSQSCLIVSGNSFLLPLAADLWSLMKGDRNPKDFSSYQSLLGTVGPSGAVTWNIANVKTLEAWLNNTNSPHGSPTNTMNISSIATMPQPVISTAYVSGTNGFSVSLSRPIEKEIKIIYTAFEYNSSDVLVGEVTREAFIQPQSSSVQIPIASLTQNWNPPASTNGLDPAVTGVKFKNQYYLPLFFSASADLPALTAGSTIKLEVDGYQILYQAGTWYYDGNDGTGNLGRESLMEATPSLAKSPALPAGPTSRRRRAWRSRPVVFRPRGWPWSACRGRYVERAVATCRTQPPSYGGAAIAGVQIALDRPSNLERMPGSKAARSGQSRRRFRDNVRWAQRGR